MRVNLPLDGSPGVYVAVELPDIEQVAAVVHHAWIDAKLRAGVTSRKSESGEELMVPYLRLSDAAKELDRATARAVYDAISSIAPTFVRHT